MTIHEFIKHHKCDKREKRELLMYLSFIRLKGMIGFFFGV